MQEEKTMSEVQKNVAAALEQLKTLQAKMHAYHPMR